MFYSYLKSSYDLQSTGDANTHQNKLKNSHNPLIVTIGPVGRGSKKKEKRKSLITCM